MITVEKSYRTEYGVSRQGSDLLFTVSLVPLKSAELFIYDLNGMFIHKFSIDDFKLAGSVYSFVIKGLDEINGFQYEYVVDGKAVNDPYQKNHSLKRTFGVRNSESETDRAVYTSELYDFGDDRQLKLEQSDIIAYQLHVRGFTKHPSSKVKAKGCFAGIIEKIPYFKELNINQIELMPAYDFYEIDELKSDSYGSDALSFEFISPYKKPDETDDFKINYWGYKKANYFSPKAEYAYSDNAVKEFKDMVKALHNAKIEIIMQMFYPSDIAASVILNSLRFWYVEYHVDGFHVMGEKLPVDDILTDSFLEDAKLYINNLNKDSLCIQTSRTNNIIDVNNSFMIATRRFLKSDSESISDFVNSNRFNPLRPKSVNYITCYEGFTLNDLVSYEYKHNETNNDNNTDGSNSNYSWNCGVEGKSSKKTVKELRIRQIKNALSILLLAQGTPMIFMGDEMMNTQYGNNNPYCQDNDTSWLNWKLNKSSEEILKFTKELIAFRKKHPVIHQKSELKNMDYLRTGFPDISYHQDMAWKSNLSGYMLHIGIMLDGSYALTDEGNKDETFYFAYNMHWENHIFGLPRLKKGMKWVPVFSSCDSEEFDEIINDLNINQDEICVYKRSIIVLKAN